MQNEYKPDVGPKLEDGGWALYVDWTLGGPHKLYVQYADRPDSKSGGVDNTASGAQVMGVAYGYSFSKRTQGYVAYNEMKNDNAAAFSFGTDTASAGGKQKVIGVGLRHSF
jgi:predicted porin